MWSRQSHILHPLTELRLPKVKFKYTDVGKKSFDDIKCCVSQNTLLAYPDFNKRFDMHTNASDYQLGAVIIQNGKPIAFHSRK